MGEGGALISAKWHRACNPATGPRDAFIPLFDGEKNFCYLFSAQVNVNLFPICMSTPCNLSFPYSVDVIARHLSFPHFDVLSGHLFYPHFHVIPRHLSFPQVNIMSCMSYLQVNIMSCKLVCLYAGRIWYTLSSCQIHAVS